MTEQPLRQALQSRTKDDSGLRIAQLEAEVGHLVAAIGEGMMSPPRRQRLQAAEADLERLRSAPKAASVATLLPRLSALIRAHVRDLAEFAEREPVRARAAVRQALDTEVIRFGLVHLDFKTQKRTPKMSAQWFREAVRQNAVR